MKVSMGKGKRVSARFVADMGVRALPERGIGLTLHDRHGDRWVDVELHGVEAESLRSLVATVDELRTEGPTFIDALNEAHASGRLKPAKRVKR